MRFSVIIPAHNASKHIYKALDSVREQHYKNYELIVVCDNCTDTTYDIANAYTDKVFNVSFGNDGLSRNTGLDVATGEYVMFMDDDDWWLHPYVLDTVNRDLLSYPETDCYCYGFVFGSLGYRRPYDNYPQPSLFPNVWSKVWRREAIGATRFPNIYYSSDMHFCSAMMDKGIALRLSDEPIYFYNYMRDGSQSSKNKEATQHE